MLFASLDRTDLGVEAFCEVFYECLIGITRVLVGVGSTKIDILLVCIEQTK